MEITRTDTGDLTATLNVNIQPEDYQDQVKAVLKDYAKRANIKGFRQGKVPPSVIRKMYGRGVVYEELNKVISSELENYIKGEELPLVGEPLPISNDIDLDPKAETAYDFEFQIGLAPIFSIDYGLAGNNPLYKILIDDETVNKEVENLQKTYGPMENPETSEAGDILFGKLFEVDADGNAVEEGFSRMAPLNPERVPSEDLKAVMADGKKADDVFPVKLEDAFQNDHEIRNFWEQNVQREKIRDVSDELLEELKQKTYHFEVRKMNRITPMEVGQEMFDKAFGEGNVTSEDEMRDRLHGDLDKFFQNEAKKFYRVKTIRSLIEGIEMPLPEAFLKDWLVRTREQVSEENIGELYPSYERSLKWRLLVEKMSVDDETMKIEEEDLRAKAAEAVRQQFGQMIPDGDDERLDSFVNYYLQDEKMVGKLYDDLLEDKVFEHLNEKNPPAEEEITATDFLEKLKED